MKTFLGGDFLLTNATAETLFREYAAPMPVIDYHCHINPKEIAENRPFGSIAELLLDGDHYKWRLMRQRGEDEGLITGGASGYDKFMAFARALPPAAGNPVYHWTHLELRRYFDCDIPLSPATAEAVWRHCGAKLSGGGFSARELMIRSGVEAIMTTDDPADSLEYHRAIARDTLFNIKVLPAFRPDQALHIEKAGFRAYMGKLGEVAGLPIRTLEDLFAALENRMACFHSLGCRASDHGLTEVPFVRDAAERAPGIFLKAMAGDTLDRCETEAYQTALLLFLGEAYHQRGWVMQLHYGVRRNANSALYMALGPDVGLDCIRGPGCGRHLADLLDAMGGSLPKTIVYSLDPNDDALLDTVCGCFTKPGKAGWVQHGSAWWYNDTKQGIQAQLTGLAARGLLGGFIGMLTDSRSFLSYTRHEYFRRLLCSLLGGWVESGEYPDDPETLGGMVRDISYHNVKRYFNL